MPRTCDRFNTFCPEVVSCDFPVEKENDMICKPNTCLPKASSFNNPNEINSFNNNLFNNQIKKKPQFPQLSNCNNFCYNIGQNYSQNNVTIPPSLITPKQKRQKFTHEEDQIIISLVGDNQFPNWNEIAKNIKGKTGRQCRERFQHYLSPKLSREPWTPQEDQLILKLYNQYGPNWALIAGHFNGKRTNNNIKNRYNNHIRFYKVNSENPNFLVYNQKPAFSPQTQLYPSYQPQTSLQISPQPSFNFNNITSNNNKQNLLSNSPSNPSMPLVSLPEKVPTHFSAPEEIPEEDSFLVPNENYYNDDIYTDNYGFMDYDKLGCDDFCDFDHSIENLHCCSDVFDFEFK